MTFDDHRHGNRDIFCRECERIIMFLLDLRVAPTVGAIEFHHITQPFIAAELIHAVLVAV